jgi:hypothetical protein
MSYDLSVLRALVRLSRRAAVDGRRTVAEPIDSEALLSRAGGDVGDVRAAVARLERCGLALRTGRGPRPTLAGLALALAAAPARAPAKARRQNAGRRVAA